MANIIQAPPVLRVTEKLKSGINEKDCEWIYIKKKLYLFPVISREQTVIPAFTEADVSVSLTYKNKRLNELVAKFFELVGEAQDGEITATLTSYKNFLLLVRELLLTNYDLTTEDINDILTLRTIEMNRLFSDLLLLVIKK